MTLRTLFLSLSFALAATACDGGSDDDKDGEDTSDTEETDETDDTEETDETDDTEETDETDPPALAATDIEGDWVSQGTDVSPLLAGFGVVRIDATFGDDGTYTVISEDSGGTQTTFSGTFVVDAATDPATITLTQTAPVASNVEGIWTVSGTTMTYDVVDTSLGTPATVSGGFGSSSAGTDNIQTFQKTP